VRVARQGSRDYRRTDERWPNPERDRRELLPERESGPVVDVECRRQDDVRGAHAEDVSSGPARPALATSGQAEEGAAERERTEHKQIRVFAPAQNYPTYLLRVRGRKSGLPRTVPIVIWEHNGKSLPRLGLWNRGLGTQFARSERSNPHMWRRGEVVDVDELRPKEAAVAVREGPRWQPVRAFLRCNRSFVPAGIWARPAEPSHLRLGGARRSSQVEDSLNRTFGTNTRSRSHIDRRHDYAKRREKGSTSLRGQAFDIDLLESASRDERAGQDRRGAESSTVPAWTANTVGPGHDVRFGAHPRWRSPSQGPALSRGSRR
jgi:hypothetical protein